MVTFKLWNPVRDALVRDESLTVSVILLCLHVSSIFASNPNLTQQLFVRVTGTRSLVTCAWTHVRGKKHGSKQQSPTPWGSSLITQRSQPTPGHFLPDLPQESSACWATDHTCWSQTILLPVPDRARGTKRSGAGESSGFFQPLAVFTSFTLTLSQSLVLIH